MPYQCSYEYRRGLRTKKSTSRVTPIKAKEKQTKPPSGLFIEVTPEDDKFIRDLAAARGVSLKEVLVSGARIWPEYARLRQDLMGVCALLAGAMGRRTLTIEEAQINRICVDILLGKPPG